MIRIAQACSILLLVINAAAAQTPATAGLVEQGAARYLNDCASCHGAAGKGDGPAAAALRTPPADLTALSRNNRGKFPIDYVERVIDGRSFEALAHGAVEMPVWGNHYRRSLGAYSELVVQRRIESLIAYLQTIQTQTSP